MRIKAFVFLLVVVVSLGSGCRKKPAYSDIDVKATERPAPDSPPDGSAASTDSTAASPAESSAAPSPAPESLAAIPALPAPNQAAQVKIPWFVDTGKGEVKDLPSYPSSRRRNISY